MDTSAVNASHLKNARTLVMIVILVMLGQASTGLSAAYGSSIASHTYTAQLGLVLCIAIVALVMMSKTDDSKVKGMSFGLLTAWVIQYGMGEMFGSMSWIAHVHAVIAMGLLLHASALMRALPASAAAIEA